MGDTYIYIYEIGEDTRAAVPRARAVVPRARAVRTTSLELNAEKMWIQLRYIYIYGRRQFRLRRKNNNKTVFFFESRENSFYIARLTIYIESIYTQYQCGC